MQLLVTGLFTVISLFIVIVGHLTILFFLYGMFTNSDALAELEKFVPMLSKPYLLIVAVLAIAVDIWIVISQKREREKKIKR